MKFRNRLYPYPVFGINNTSTFRAELSVECTIESIILNVSNKLSEEELLALFKKNEIIYVTHIYCRSTFFRESYVSNKPLKEIKIESARLNDLVEVDFSICANKSITNYNLSSFDDDFSEYNFEIEKGDILAYAGTATFFAKKSPHELKAISAFMQIDTDGKSKNPFRNDYEGDKITIYLSKEDYAMYQNLKSESFLKNTLHSSIVLPALSEAIRVVKENNSELSQYKWHVILNNLMISYDHESPLIIAQNILDLPVNRAFNTLYSYAF